MHNANQNIWQNWAKKLQQLGLQDFTAAFFETTGPLNLLGAQLIYISQPILNTFIRNDRLTALAALLEEPENTKTFLEILHEKNQ